MCRCLSQDSCRFGRRLAFESHDTDRAEQHGKEAERGSRECVELPGHSEHTFTATPVVAVTDLQVVPEYGEQSELEKQPTKHVFAPLLASTHQFWSPLEFFPQSPE